MNIQAPNNFSEFIINKKNAKILSGFNKNNLNNILFYGNKNTGKKTLLNCFIKHLFNKDSFNIQNKEDLLKYKNKNYSCTYKYTKYYYDIDFLKNIKCSKYIINDFLKNICNNKCIDNSYRIIIIHNLNYLDVHLIHAFLNIVEENYKFNKFILIYNTTNIKLFNKMISLFFTLRCNIDKNELKKYIETNNFKLTKKITPVIYTCNNLYYINLLLEFKSLELYKPIEKYVKKIYSIIKKYNTILFLEHIRPLLYEMYLHDFSLTELIQTFITFLLNKNKNISDINIHLLYHLGAKYDPLKKGFFQPFTLVESFFIEVKKLDICI